MEGVGQTHQVDLVGGGVFLEGGRDSQDGVGWRCSSAGGHCMDVQGSRV